MTRISAAIRQWCKNCQDFTRSVPCDACGAPEFTCADCGRHPGCTLEEED